jgi:hypothetical protein
MEITKQDGKISKSDNRNNKDNINKKRSSTKKELYKNEREEIINEIYEILKIKETKTFKLHNMENSAKFQEKIMKLEERVKRYYETRNLKIL